MRAEAVVIETTQNKAKVKSVRQSACASCANCEGKNHCHAMLIFGEQEQSVEIFAENAAGGTGVPVLVGNAGITAPLAMNSR